MTCRHVKVKENEMNEFMSHMKSFFPESLATLNKPLNKMAFPVEYADVDPITGKKRLFLVSNNNVSILGWVYEDLVEDVNFCNGED